MIEFSNINFLTGKNGSGKSTIIDALQLLLLGDTRGNFFNKAANDRTERTLEGYLRGEISALESYLTFTMRVALNINFLCLMEVFRKMNL